MDAPFKTVDEAIQFLTVNPNMFYIFKDDLARLLAVASNEEVARYNRFIRIHMQ